MKKQKWLYIIFTLFFWQSITVAQASVRDDVVWARMVPAGTITLDGNLDEAAWAQAEEVKVVYGKPGPLPTSAWRPEFQEEVYFDQTNATVKFLTTTDNQLYLAFNIPDSSVGGTKDWARWDGILMSVKNKSSVDRPAPADEYFYTYWLEGLPDSMKIPVAGASPRFIGKWGTWADTTRTPEGKAAWDAVTTILGTSNNDSTADEGWIVEMRIDLGVEGYDVTALNGDVVAMNFSIWDCDWVNGDDPSKVASSRTWFQSPWGNANAINVARVFGHPDVTLSTTALPKIEPDAVIPNGVNLPSPVIDGNLDDEVWKGAFEFDIEWGNDELRASYPTTGPLSSGQFQPEINGNPRPPVVDPALGTFKMFFRDNYLYLAADVNDQLVQGKAEFDQIDGVRWIFGDRSSVGGDNFMNFKQLRINFGADGTPVAEEYLAQLADSGFAEWSVKLKGSTTVNDNSDVDEGYVFEVKLDLQKLGYPVGLGDQLLFGGIMLADGDSFDDPLANYGTRTWAFREHDGGPAAAWIYMDTYKLISSGGELQSGRQDVVWAKMAPAGSITLDGNLNEDVWSKASEVKVVYGKQGPLPTSAWRPEFQEEVYFDQTNATVKFLTTTDNQLYLAFNIPDASVGGTKDWARWDGILMSVKNKSSVDRPAPADEYFYTYWLEGLPEEMKTPVPGASPRFIGKWGTWADTTRTPEGKAAWDAVTTIMGTSNDDSTADEGWIVEMRIDLGVQGYDVTVPNGDVVAMNFSIWDCDWVNGDDPSKVASSRTWFQSPWGNANANNVARVFASPNVTTESMVLPVVDPDIIVPNAANFQDPLIDGKLDEEVWQGAVNFDIEWDNTTLRNSYPTVGPLTSGQFQPELGGNPRPPVLDPASANIKMFFKDNYLYLAADVNDQLIQGSEEYDKIDGLSFIIGDRVTLNGDNQTDFRAFRVSFDGTGNAAAYDYLPVITDTGKAEWNVVVKGSSTVNDNSDVDEGYQFEMKIDLTALGYPPDLGDKLLFMGVMLADGDSFEDPLANYGTRTWFFREHTGGPSAAWAVLSNDLLVGVESDNITYLPKNIEIFGNYPNPFNPSTKIRFAVPEAGNVKIAVYNSIGQLIKDQIVNVSSGGMHEYQFNSSNLSSGVYYYKVSLSGVTKNTYESKVGKMILLK